MMPMADVFGADINFSSARDVYPTMPGGTTSSAAGAMTANTNVSSSGADGGATTVTNTGVDMSGRSLLWWVGFLAFLLVMVFVARKAGGEEEFRNIRATFYNFMTITLTAIVGIVGMKVIAARWRIPGASDIILAA
jgi:FtsH-binding integral membrane protein